jgi:hypothetical protein
MEDNLDLIVKCEDPEKIVSCVDELYVRLNRETRDKLRHIRMVYLMEFGKQGLFDRVVNRSVAQILELYDKSVDIDLEESGERDGVGFKLFSPRNDKTID